MSIISINLVWKIENGNFLTENIQINMTLFLIQIQQSKYCARLEWQ